MISKDTLDVLICTKCHEQLEYKSEFNNLTCNCCGHVYPIENNVLIMIIEEKENERTTE